MTLDSQSSDVPELKRRLESALSEIHSKDAEIADLQKNLFEAKFASKANVGNGRSGNDFDDLPVGGGSR